jgi:uncharacterized protein YjbI with pentapeptide repeats
MEKIGMKEVSDFSIRNQNRDFAIRDEADYFSGYFSGKHVTNAVFPKEMGDMSGHYAVNSLFENVIFSETCFYAANLCESSFEHCIFDKVDFQKCELQSIKANNCIYILNKRMEDRKQNRDLALTIPILLYHGSAALEKETPTTLFPKAPKNLLKYVPSFDYIILDISHLKDSEIEAIKFVDLRNIFLAFKYSRNEKYLAEHWKKVIIFAAQTVKNFPLNIIIKATFLYMVHVSQTVSKKSKNLDNELSSEEKGSLLPFIPEFLVDSFKKGKAEGIPTPPPTPS